MWLHFRTTITSGIGFRHEKWGCECEWIHPFWLTASMNRHRAARFEGSISRALWFQPVREVTHRWLRYAGLKVFMWSPESAESLPSETRQIYPCSWWLKLSRSKHLTAACPEEEAKGNYETHAISMNSHSSAVRNSAGTLTIKDL